MRMWMVDPKIMCRQHLLAEHNELHMFVGALNKQKKVDGFIRNNCLEISSIVSRHAELVAEMKSRGYKHNSPLDEYPNVTYLTADQMMHIIDKETSLALLTSRCSNCGYDKP